MQPYLGFLFSLPRFSEQEDDAAEHLNADGMHISMT